MMLGTDLDLNKCLFFFLFLPKKLKIFRNCIYALSVFTENDAHLLDYQSSFPWIHKPAVFKLLVNRCLLELE